MTDGKPQSRFPSSSKRSSKFVSAFPFSNGLGAVNDIVSNASTLPFRYAISIFIYRLPRFTRRCCCWRCRVVSGSLFRPFDAWALARCLPSGASDIIPYRNGVCYESRLHRRAEEGSGRDLQEAEVLRGYDQAARVSVPPRPLRLGAGVRVRRTAEEARLQAFYAPVRLFHAI